MLKTRIAAGGLATALSITLLPAAALGAGDTLTVSGKKHVKAGSKTTIAISGRSSKQRGLAIYLDKRSCARAVLKEQRRGSSNQLVVKSVHGPFRDTVTFERSSSGKHFICAYLYHKKGNGFATDRHAGFRYVTR